MGKAKAQGFQLGQEGMFPSLNAFGVPVDRVEGRIIYLAEFNSKVYAILQTPAGVYCSLRIN